LFVIIQQLVKKTFNRWEAVRKEDSRLEFLIGNTGTFFYLHRKRRQGNNTIIMTITPASQLGDKWLAGDDTEEPSEELNYETMFRYAVTPMWTGGSSLMNICEAWGLWIQNALGYSGERKSLHKTTKVAHSGDA
jgi:hypothetical protein